MEAKLETLAEEATRVGEAAKAKMLGRLGCQLLYAEDGWIRR